MTIETWRDTVVLVAGFEYVPKQKILEAEQEVLAWTDEQEADRDEPCICFFSSPNYHTGWRVVEGGDAGSLAEASVCIGLADALEAWSLEPETSPDVPQA